MSRCTQEHFAQFVSRSQGHLLPFPSCPLSSRLHTRCLYPWGKPTSLQDRAPWDWAARQAEGISSLLPTSPTPAPGSQLTFPQGTAEPPPHTHHTSSKTACGWVCALVPLPGGSSLWAQARKHQKGPWATEGIYKVPQNPPPTAGKSHLWGSSQLLNPFSSKQLQLCQ